MSWTGSIDIAVHSINTIEKPARVIWQNDINCMKGLFVEKLCDFSERFLLSATRPNGKKKEKKQKKDKDEKDIPNIGSKPEGSNV